MPKTTKQLVATQMPLESQGVYYFHPPSKKLAAACLGVIFSIFGFGSLITAFNVAGVFAKITTGSLAALFLPVTAIILSDATLKQSVSINIETGTYTLTRRRFSRMQILEGNVHELDILLMKSYHVEYGDSIWIRNRKANWKLLVRTEVPLKSSNDAATKLAEKLGLSVSELW